MATAAVVLALGGAAWLVLSDEEDGPGGGARDAGSISFGISDQSFYAFGNPQLRQLGLKRARIVVSYDVVAVGERGFRGGDPNQPGELENLDRWMAAARREGYEPVVAFGYSRTRPKSLPSVREYRRHVDAFLDRYARGGYLLLSAWNEPNHPAQPTFGRPERAAAYYDAARDVCGRRCEVVAGDFAQIKRYERGPGGLCGRPAGSRSCDAGRFPEDRRRLSQATYLRRYRAAIGEPTPVVWGYHPYGDVNGVSGGPRGTLGTRSFAAQALRGTKGAELWLTEVGGVLEDALGQLEVEDETAGASPARGEAPEPTAQEREQVAEIRHLLEAVVHAHPRITRLYYYSFRHKGIPVPGGCRASSSFDSALVRECSREHGDRVRDDGSSVTDRTTTPRPAYEVFKEAVASGGK